MPLFWTIHTSSFTLQQVGGALGALILVNVVDQHQRGGFYGCKEEGVLISCDDFPLLRPDDLSSSAIR
jgi:hypothetical protein